MAKRKAEAAPVLDMVPVSAEVQETSADGAALVGWFQGLAEFFAGATKIETAAIGIRDTARSLKAPESSAADEVIQKFVQRTNVAKKEVEGYWGICSQVHRLHRRLTAKRDLSVKAIEEANTIGNRLHNEYVRLERVRAEAEERRRREQAEFEAREVQRQELERAEAEALEKEAAAEGLSEREARWVELYMARPIDAVRHAATVGYKDYRRAAEKLLASPKILAAIDAKRQAEAIRRQAQAQAARPPVYDYEEAKPDVTQAAGVSERTTKSAEVVDVEAFLKAALSGQFGIPVSCLAVNQTGLNAAAREMGAYINRWPGVRFVEKTRVI